MKKVKFHCQKILFLPRKLFIRIIVSPNTLVEKYAFLIKKRLSVGGIGIAAL